MEGNTSIMKSNTSIILQNYALTAMSTAYCNFRLSYLHHESLGLNCKKSSLPPLDPMLNDPKP
jgi:hypothetical protein